MNSDKPKEFIQCTFCKENYDIVERKPCCYMPCGHTLCSKCINESTDKICSICREHVNQVIPDYTTIDSVLTAPHFEAKREPKTATNQTIKLAPKNALTKNMKSKMLAFMKSDQT